MRTMKTLDAPGLLLLPLGQRRIDATALEGQADDDHAADHEDDEDAGRAWTPAATAGAAPNRRQSREAAGRANRDEELEEGLDDEDDEEHDEHATLPRNVGAANDGDDCAKTMMVCAARTDCPRRPG